MFTGCLQDVYSGCLQHPESKIFQGQCSEFTVYLVKSKRIYFWDRYTIRRVSRTAAADSRVTQAARILLIFWLRSYSERKQPPHHQRNLHC